MKSRHIKIAADGKATLDGCAIGTMRHLGRGVLQFTGDPGTITGDAWHNMRWELSVMYHVPESNISRDSWWSITEPASDQGRVL